MNQSRRNILKGTAWMGAAALAASVFAAEVVPADYQPVAYIEGNGSQYIDTGVVATSNTAVYVDFTPMTVSASQVVVCDGPVTDPVRQMTMEIYINATGFWAASAFSKRANAGNDAWGSSSPLIDEMPVAGKRVRICNDSFGNVVSCDGRLVLRLAHARNGKGSSSLKLFKARTGDKCMAARVHALTIFSAGDVQADLVPCRRVKDGVAGLYDRARDRFLVNAGTGAGFVAGPVVPEAPARLVAVPSAFPKPQPFCPGVFNVASWNVGHWALGRSNRSSLCWNIDAHPRAAAYRAAIDMIDADWFGVCEYSTRFCAGDWVDANVAVFRRYPGVSVGPSESYQWNAAFYNPRFKVLETKVDYYPTHRQNVYAYQHRVLVDGLYEMWFVQTHLDWFSPEMRMTQIKWLIEHFADQPRVAISGDFNTTMKHQITGRHCTRVADFEDFAAAGFSIANTLRPTCCGPNGVLIDNFVTKGFAISAVEIPREAGLSDHQPIRCTLRPLASGEVARPAPPMLVPYDREAHLPTIPVNQAYTISPSDPRTEPGDYPIVVSLKDKEHTKWDDGTTGDLHFVFHIVK